MRPSPLVLLLAACGAVTDEGVLPEPGDTADLTHDPVAILSVAEAAPSLDDPAVQWIDARSADAYAAGHIAGASSVPWTDLLAEIAGVPGQVATPEVVADHLASAGIRRDVQVIAYDDRAGRDAGRLLWTLRHYGQVEAALLDGGIDQWRAAGLPETRASTHDFGDWTPEASATPIRVTAQEILQHLDDPTWVLVDVRTAAEFAEGHIPGALHRDWTGNVALDGPDEGMLRPRAELMARYADVPPDATIVVYCRTGARAGQAWVMLPWLGFEDVRLYDGSWAEWSTWPEAPVAR